MPILKKILFHFGIWLSIISTLNIVLYVTSKIPTLGIFLLLLWIISWLIMFKSNKNKRFQHSIVIIFDIIITLIFFLLLYIFINQYSALVNNTPSTTINIVNYILSSFHISIPKLQFEIFIIFSLVYSCILLMLRASFINIINNNEDFFKKIFQNIYDIAYITELSGTYLKPWVTFSKPFAFIFMILGCGLFIWYFSSGVYYSAYPIPWLVWFFDFFIVIAVDWYLWLSGTVHKYSYEPKFEEQKDDDVEKNLLYEDLWKRYHKFWKEKWLVAGNISTGPKKNGEN
ncbi:hypothetical protein [Psychrobacter sp. I-STPA10]|uniref:hypothetical protein n=1 Tax=Psychrobacter sp. I-STPA10 TaxID=2585769 RepID=UPI001E309FC4|nr:hypothetical protein [Psychrobacter sp. I-STPA10]